MHDPRIARILITAVKCYIVKVGSGYQEDELCVGGQPLHLLCYIRQAGVGWAGVEAFVLRNAIATTVSADETGIRRRGWQQTFYSGGGILNEPISDIKAVETFVS
jgi:hypothetical protein